MIKGIKIKNFRCLKSVQVPLRPLTVLLGPNDSGKSAFLAALRHGMDDAKLSPFDVWRNGPADEVVVLRSTDQGDVVRKGNQAVYARLDGATSFPLEFFLLPSTGIRMTSEGYPDEGQPPALSAEGGNAPALLDHLLRRDRDRFDEFVKAMGTLVDGLQKIEIATPSKDTRRIDLVIEGGFRVPADHSSVGLRLILFFVALAYHPSPPRTILIEEPENGVHPKRLADIMRLLREITQGKHGGHAAQVILTTHSPHLLDHVDLAVDQVLVFSHNKDGSRSAEPADADRLKTFLDEFMLGEVWYNEGEAGLVRPAK